MTERWVKQVRQLVKKYKTPGIERVTFTPDAVEKLLARQHRAMVRMVKRVHHGKYVPDYRKGDFEAYTQGYLDCRNDVLAALAKQRGGKT